MCERSILHWEVRRVQDGEILTCIQAMSNSQHSGTLKVLSDHCLDKGVGFIIDRGYSTVRM